MRNCRLFTLFLLICILICTLPSCENLFGPGEFIDYVDQVKFNPNSGRKWEEVTVKLFIDGDTTHFNASFGTLKARYIAINTPESTGAVEEWGKAASRFTKEKLSQENISIIVESDSSKWEIDSTGDRHLVWVWYKTPDMADYRNLNIEILQNGLAIASSSSENTYGDICMKAIEQAQEHLLYVYSDEIDPDYFYGDVVNVTLPELVINPEAYTGKYVAFEGVITKYDGTSFYVEDYCEIHEMYHGVYIFPGYALKGSGLKIVNVGNRIKVVGWFDWSDIVDAYQVSDLQYRALKPEDPRNIQLISEGHSGAYQQITPYDFANAMVEVDTEEEILRLPLAELAMYTTVEMQNLRVIDAYTTTNDDSKNKGAISLTCVAPDGTRVTVRTAVLLDENGNLVTEDYFMNKVIDVKGIVNKFEGKYQIKLLSINDVTFK